MKLSFVVTILGVMMLAVVSPANGDVTVAARPICSETRDRLSETKLKLKTTNPELLTYATTGGLSADLESISTLMHESVGLDLNFASSSLLIQDMGPGGFRNGEFDPHQLSVKVYADQESTLLQLRQTLIHEVGHFAFAAYLNRDSMFYQRFLRAYQTSRQPMPPRETPEYARYEKTQALAGALVNSVTEIGYPYFEFAADLVRVMVLREPGVGARRDFSALGTQHQQSNLLDDHDVFNSVRGAVWERKLGGMVNDPEKRNLFFARSLRVLSERMDYHLMMKKYAESYKVDWRAEAELLKKLLLK